MEQNSNKSSLLREVTRISNELGIPPLPGLTAPSSARPIKVTPLPKQSRTLLSKIYDEQEIGIIEYQASFQAELDRRWRVATLSDARGLSEGDMIAFVYKDDGDDVFWRGSEIIPVSGVADNEIYAEGWSFDLNDVEGPEDTLLANVQNCDTSWTLYVPK